MSRLHDGRLVVRPVRSYTSPHNRIHTFPVNKLKMAGISRKGPANHATGACKLTNFELTLVTINSHIASRTSGSAVAGSCVATDSRETRTLFGTVGSVEAERTLFLAEGTVEAGTADTFSCLK